MKTKTINIYEVGDVVYDVSENGFFFLANRVPEHETPRIECFSAFRLSGNRFSDPRVIAQDTTKGNDRDTVRYVGKLYDYLKAFELGSLSIKIRQ